MLVLAGLLGVLGSTVVSANDLPGSAVIPWLFALGVLAGGTAFMLLLALTAALTGGFSTLSWSVGLGRWAGSLRVGGRLLVLRRLPLFPVVLRFAVVDRPGLRPRLWTAVAAPALLTAAGAAALTLCGGGRTAAVGWGAMAVLVVLPITANRPMAAGWILLRLPSRPSAEVVREWAGDPATVRAARLLATGRAAAARAELAAAPPADGPRRRAVAAAVAVATGRFDEGARAAHTAAEASRVPQLQAEALGVYATALGCGAATRLWDPEAARPEFAAALASIRRIHPSLVRNIALGALESLLAGDLGQAARRAARSARRAPDRFTRAQAFAVQAVALRAAGHPAKAARALRRARRLAPDAELLAPAAPTAEVLAPTA